MRLPDYPDQSTLAPVAWQQAFTGLLIDIDGEPGHSVDLSKVLDFDDDPDAGKLLIVLPAPAMGDDAPHALVLSGESRTLALRYVRWRVAMTKQLLMALPD